MPSFQRILGLTLLIAGTTFSALSLAAAEVAHASTKTIPQVAQPRPTALAARALGKLPMRFEANRGQTDQQVEFLSRGQGYTLFLAGNEAVLSLREQNRTSRLEGSKLPASNMLRMKLAGANQAVQPVGVDLLTSKSNYFIGNDPVKWRRNVPNYARVRYEGVYTGIDLVYYGNQEQLEFDFVVAPGADPELIRFALETGTTPSRPNERDGTPLLSKEGNMGWSGALLRVADNGDLVFKTGSDSEMRFHKPVVYQGEGDKRRAIEGSYILLADNHVGFEVGPYDNTRPLVIDPVLSYSTYLGGLNTETGDGIAADSTGNIYVAGSTVSVAFPTKNPFQTVSAGNFDVFVTKIDPTGAALVYSTYLGGSGSDRAAGMAIDSSGSIHVAGTTNSTDFPTTSSAFQKSFAGGACGSDFCSDAFAAKIKADGTGLDYATYLGGNNADGAAGIALDSGGAAFITGTTQSANFPTAAALQAASAGNSDAFLTKLAAGGASPTYSTYLGGTSIDSGLAVGVDSNGNAVVAGYTLSTDFPMTAALQSTNHGKADIFVTKINTAGDARVFSTYLGGAESDRARAVALDAAGNVYVGGETYSTDFPVSSSAFQLTLANGTCGTVPCPDGFLTKLNPAGATTLFSTYLGGTDADQLLGISVNSAEEAFVTGSTASNDFPLLNPLQAVIGGGTCTLGPCPDAFVSRFGASGSTLISSTFLGGNTADFGRAIYVDETNAAYVTGQAASPNFPATPTAFQATPGGTSASGDAFAVRIGPADLPSLVVSPLKVTFEDQPQGFASDAITVTLTNPGTAPVTFASFTTSGDFAQTNTCEPTLAVSSATCPVAVTFTPTATGDRTGELTITSDVAGSPVKIPLAGKGITPISALTFSPRSYEFPDLDVGATSAPVTITITNSGFADLTIAKVDKTGDYVQTNNCPTSPNKFVIGATCTADVAFAPTGSGVRSGSLFVTSDVAGNAGTNRFAEMTGKGIGVFTLSSPANAATVKRGTQSATFTVQANGPESFTGDVALTCQSTTQACTFSPASIKVGQTSTVTISALDRIPGTNTSITVRGTNNLQFSETTFTITFSDYSITAKPTFGTVASGDSFVVRVTLTPTNGFDGNATFICGSLPAESTCSFSPTTVTLDGTGPATVDVTIKTTTRVTTWAPPRAPAPPNPWLTGGLALMAVTLILGAGRRRVRLALLAIVLLALLFMGSCNDYYTYEYSGTLPGTFPVEIGSKVGNVGHSATFNLTVL